MLFYILESALHLEAQFIQKKMTCSVNKYFLLSVKLKESLLLPGASCSKGG